MSKEASRPLTIELNLLPAEYRRRALAGRNMVLILLVVIALLPLYLVAQARQYVVSETVQAQSTLKRVKAQIAELKVNENQAKKLQGAVDAAQQELDAMNRDYKALRDGRVTWAPVLRTVYDALPSAVTLEQIVQQGTKLTLQGKASNNEASVTYAKRLKESGAFTSVGLQLGGAVEQPGQQAGASRAVNYTLVLQVKVEASAKE